MGNTNETDLTTQNGSVDPFLRDGIGSFPERLEQVIGEQSVRQFAHEIGLSEGAVRAFKQGRIPRADDALAIARYRGVDLMWLLSGEGPAPSGLEPTREPLGTITEGAAGYASHMNDATFNEEFALIDGYHVEVGAGVGQLVEEEPVRRKLAFRHKWLRYRQLNPADLALVFAKGDSMEPTIHSGDTILIDTAKTHIVDGSVFVIRLSDALYAKRLQKLPDGGVNIISDNPGYSMLTVPGRDMQTIQVIGKVVWIGHDV